MTSRRKPSSPRPGASRTAHRDECRQCATAADILQRLDPALGGPDRDLLSEYRRPAPEVVAAKERWQDPLIVEAIPEGASVLDLGCGDGDLLERLMRTKSVRGQGIELDPLSVVRCVERGVPVFQSDLDEGLAGFPDGTFDYVALEETLQTLRRPLKVLGEMLRVGRHGIVSFPNFAYWRIRMGLLLEGRMPRTPRLPYAWHDTPNIHLFSLQDFLDWTSAERVTIVRAFALVEGGVRSLGEGDNLDAEEVLFFLSK